MVGFSPVVWWYPQSAWSPSAPLLCENSGAHPWLSHVRLNTAQHWLLAKYPPKAPPGWSWSWLEPGTFQSALLPLWKRLEKLCSWWQSRTTKTNNCVSHESTGLSHTIILVLSQLLSWSLFDNADGWWPKAGQRGNFVQSNLCVLWRTIKKCWQILQVHLENNVYKWVGVVFYGLKRTIENTIKYRKILTFEKPWCVLTQHGERWLFCHSISSVKRQTAMENNKKEHALCCLLSWKQSGNPIFQYKIFVIFYYNKINVYLLSLPSWGFIPLAIQLPVYQLQ